MSRTKRDHGWAGRWFAGIKDEALGRDKKPRSKPPSWYKKMKARGRKAKQKQALLQGKELPTEKKDNVWNWN